jgi:TolB-like protein
LPFDNLSGDPEQEYFSDGITDSIILNLSMFRDLQVKSRNSSFAFKKQIKSLGEISSELGVDYLVEGSLRKSAEQIRITVQLVEAVNGNQVWGKRYDAPLADLFNLEEELSRSIAATVTGQIESDLQRIALAKGAADQQAYDFLLAGIYHLYRQSRRHRHSDRQTGAVPASGSGQRPRPCSAIPMSHHELDGPSGRRLPIVF